MVLISFFQLSALAMGGKDVAWHADHDSGWCLVPGNSTETRVHLLLSETDFGLPVEGQINLADAGTTNFRVQRTILRGSSHFPAIFEVQVKVEVEVEYHFFGGPGGFGNVKFGLSGSKLTDSSRFR